jgi:hypothetical protein
MQLSVIPGMLEGQDPCLIQGYVAKSLPFGSELQLLLFFLSRFFIHMPTSI